MAEGQKVKEPSLVEPDYFDDDIRQTDDVNWQEVIDRRNERVDEALEWHGMEGF